MGLDRPAAGSGSSDSRGGGARILSGSCRPRPRPRPAHRRAAPVKLVTSQERAVGPTAVPLPPTVPQRTVPQRRREPCGTGTSEYPSHTSRIRTGPYPYPSDCWSGRPYTVRPSCCERLRYSADVKPRATRRKWPWARLQGKCDIVCSLV